MKRLNYIYTIQTKKKPTAPGCWDYLDIEIFKEGIKIGEYQRNYSTNYNDWCPFEFKGKEYALYSHDYETVSIMSLPDCKLIAEHNSGFCPVDFAIPDIEDEYFIKFPYAIVAGCCWGDDSGGWKLEAVFILSNKEEYNELDSVCKNALDYLCNEWDYVLILKGAKLTEEQQKSSRV